MIESLSTWALAAVPSGFRLSQGVTIPVDNQSRGRLRLWRAQATLRAAALARAFNSNATGAAVDALFFKGAVGRARALRRLRRAFEGNGARWTGTPEAPRWSWINPAFDLFGDPPVISMGCIWADRSGAALFSRPIWCLAVSEHACARFFQRSPPDASLDDALFEGHANVLHLSTTCLIERKKAGAAPYYRLVAGAGAFATDVVVADKKADNGLLQTMLLYGRTWIHADALSERQEAQIVPPGEVGDRFSEIFWQPVAAIRGV